MAIKVTLDGITSKALAKAIIKKLGTTKDLAPKIKAYVIEEIKLAIGGKTGNARAAQAFQPLKQPNAEELVGKLGVGKGGSFNLDKLTNAWRQLLPEDKDGFGIAKVTGSFSIKRIKSGKLGQFTYKLNKEEFLNTRLSTFGYLNRRFAADDAAKGESGLVIIPWMRHYIEGVVVDGFGFSKKLNQTSRTGVGIMVKIPRGSFKIPPLNIQPFNEVEEAIKRRFKSGAFKAGFRAIIKKAVGS